MKWLFRRIRADEVERDITQRSQFDTDDTRLQATLIREAHQNSLDARPKGATGPVRTRIRFFEPTNDEQYFEDLFEGLPGHLSASGIAIDGIDFKKPRFLLIEDFGTTGLTGEWGKKDKKPFSDFWRREGRSHKGGASNGRWGLGKLVFSSASRIRTFFGLTIRHDDPGQALLMGEAVLATHEIGEATYNPYGFYANVGAEDIQVPETKAAEIQRFAAAVGIQRAYEAGFSVIIPFPLKDLQPKDLIEGVIANYFYPILTGELEVEVEGELISAGTFDEIAARYATTNSLNHELIAFIRQIHAAKDQMPTVTLDASWSKSMESAFDSSTLEELRKAYADTNAFIHVRLPIALKPKDGNPQSTSFDLFLKKAPDGILGTSLYIRSTITVPQESRNFPATDVFAALLAKDTPIASFLGDAENPAHTQWSVTAEKLRDNWKSAHLRLGEIRKSLRELYRVIAQMEERKEPDAIIDFFSIEDMSPGKKPNPKVVVKPPMPDLPLQEKTYRIARRSGGFAVKADKGIEKESLPILLKIQVAYDVLNGNPLRRYDPLDFRIDSAPITINSVGATCTHPFPNRVDIEVTEKEFSVEVEGFDVNRDLFIDARKDGQ